MELAGRDLTASLPGGQARVLFTYLAVNRARRCRREQMIEAHMREDHPELVGKVTRQDLIAMAEEA